MGPVSMINTHLAYHDSRERQQQLERLNLLDQERKNQICYPKKLDRGAYQKGPSPVARILCGDFNFGIETPEYEFQLNNTWIDAWTASSSNLVHPPTCGIFDHEQWPQGPHCRDFFWLSDEFVSSGLDMKVDTKTPLSDHQPIILEIDI
jgi:endonuclease/exonuclease/phosphatase family metal-dependent hydrolase